MKSTSGFSELALEKMVARLSELVADIHQLMVKSLGYHWNVEDPRFLQLHDLFEEGYQQLFKDLDTVAERVRVLGYVAPQSVQELMDLASLPDTEKAETGDEMIDFLTQDYEALTKRLRSHIEEADSMGDAGTSDMLTTLLQNYETYAWKLRSHLPSGR